MESDSLQASIQHETAELRSLDPSITLCHAVLEQWKEGADSRYSLRLDIRWPQRQRLISGGAWDNPHAALRVAFDAARRAAVG